MRTMSSCVVSIDAPRSDQPASLENGDPVAVLEHVIEVVADQQDRESLVAHLPDQRIDLSCFFNAERRGRLVENHDRAR